MPSDDIIKKKTAKRREIMELLRRRPLALICTVAILLMLASLAFSPLVFNILIAVFIACGVSALAVAAVSLIKRRTKWFRMFSCVFLFFLISIVLMCGIFNFYVYDYRAIISKCSGEAVNIEGEVISVAYKGDYGEKYYVNVSKLNGRERNFKSVLEFSSESELSEGKAFIVSGVGGELDEYEEYLISDGYILRVSCDDPDNLSVTGDAKETVFSFLRELNREMKVRIYMYTDDETGPLTSALILGNRDDIGDKVNKDFRRSGLVHALSLSGLHMTIIMGFFEFLLRSIRVNKKVRCVVMIAAALFYLALTGFSAPAVRSVIMASSIYISYLFYTQSDGVTALVVAAAIILLISPTSLFDVSLWMSEFATLGLIVAAEIVSPLGYKIKKRKLIVRVGYKILLSLSLTLSAVFFVMIFSWLCFGELSLMSPISNIVINPLFDIMIVLGLLLLPLSYITPLGNLIGLALNTVCRIVLELLDLVSEMRGIVLSLNYGFSGFIVVALTVAIAVFLLIKVKHKWTISLIPAASIAAFAVCLSVFLNQNQGITKTTYLREDTSEMLVLTNNSAATICDISTGGFGHMYNAYKAAFVNCQTEIENVVLTHYHIYHTNSLWKLTQKYTVRNVYLPIPYDEADEEIYDDIVRALYNTSTNVITYKPGYDIYAEESCNINVSMPFYIGRSTHPMFLIRVKGEGNTAENELLYYSSPLFENEAADYPTRPDYVIIGAHGPRIHEPPALDRVNDWSPDVLLLADGEKMIFSDENLPILKRLLHRMGTEIAVDRFYYEFIINTQKEQ